jgi:hypothetical protein
MDLITGNPILLKILLEGNLSESSLIAVMSSDPLPTLDSIVSKIGSLLIMKLIISNIYAGTFLSKTSNYLSVLINNGCHFQFAVLLTGLSSVFPSPLGALFITSITPDGIPSSYFNLKEPFD